MGVGGVEQGEPLAEGTYCYIVFNRKDQTFEMYQKFDSMYGRHITGSFAIKNDPYQGYIISGSYDNGMGDWNQSYLVTRLLASGSMIWTAKDNVTDICRYKRCDEVPTEILKECKDLTRIKPVWCSGGIYHKFFPKRPVLL